MKLKATAFVAPAVALSCVLPSCTAVKESSDKPNFVVIFADDLGYGDLACYGHPTIQTPNLDEMAYQGQKWSSFYVSASVSSPSRAGLLTGRMNVRTGMYGRKTRVLFPSSINGMPAEEITIAELLQDNGYTTACVGKWHLGHRPEHMPLEHGFDQFYGAPFSNDMSRREQVRAGAKDYPYEYVIYDQDKIVDVEPNQDSLAYRYNQRAISFIEENRDEPFFLYLAHPMPHWPLHASESFQGGSARGLYGDAVEELDHCVGEILQTLKDNDLDENTIVLFISDNGPWPGAYEGGSAGHMRGVKGSIYDGGFRVPCIAWGGMVEPGHIVDMGSTLDLFPTICDMASIPMPTDRVYDGVSLRDVFEHKADSPRDEFPYYKCGYLNALRKGDYKVVLGDGGQFAVDTQYDNPQLYNVAFDPEERYDVAASEPEKVKELIECVKRYNAQVEVKPALFDALNGPIM